VTAPAGSRLAVGLRAIVTHVVGEADTAAPDAIGQMAREMAEAYGARVTALRFAPGTRPDPAAVVAAIKADPSLVAASGANAIAVVSDASKAEYVFNLGAKGVINRKDFKCWGPMPKVGSRLALWPSASSASRSSSSAVPATARTATCGRSCTRAAS